MKIFITGTDTNIGKTYVSIQLLKVLNQQFKTIATKLIASGAELINGKYVNDDALQLQAAASIKLPYDLINPFVFCDAIAPNIAAKNAGVALTISHLNHAANKIFEIPADIYLFEGVGGWHIPLNDEEILSSFIKQNDFQVIFVVGMRLGCLNHALLTARAMLFEQVEVLGWIANCLDHRMQHIEENIATLKTHLPFPYFGKVDFNASFSSLSFF